MYNMYPDFQQDALRERGAGGLGHPDWYPTGTENETSVSSETKLTHAEFSPQVDRTLGYVVVKGMIDD